MSCTGSSNSGSTVCFCTSVFSRLKNWGLSTPKLVISDANKGLVSAVKHCFSDHPGIAVRYTLCGTSCHVSLRNKKIICFRTEIHLACPDDKVARERTNALIEKYESRFPQAVRCLEEGLEDSLIFYSYPELDQRKISSSNMIERLNREIQRRTSAVGIFPNESSYVRLVTAYLMEYSEDWSTSRAYIKEESISRLLPKDAA